jgi:predicted small secreted protein
VKKLFILLLLLSLFATGCECVGGLGRDIQKSGEWMEEQSTE